MDHSAAPQGWDSGWGDSFNFNDPRYIDLFEDAYFELFQRLPPPGTHIWGDLAWWPEPAAEARNNQTDPAYTHGSGRAEHDPADRGEHGPAGQEEHSAENRGEHHPADQEEHGTTYQNQNQRQYAENEMKEWTTEQEKRTEEWIKRIDQLNTDQLQQHLQEYGAPEQTTREVRMMRINGAAWKQMMEDNTTSTKKYFDEVMGMNTGAYFNYRGKLNDYYKKTSDPLDPTSSWSICSAFHGS